MKFIVIASIISIMISNQIVNADMNKIIVCTETYQNTVNKLFDLVIEVEKDYNKGIKPEPIEEFTVSVTKLLKECHGVNANYDKINNCVHDATKLIPKAYELYNSISKHEKTGEIVAHSLDLAIQLVKTVDFCQSQQLYTPMSISD